MTDMEPLSTREREVAGHYAQGSTYHEIAGQLGISPSTVRTHLAAIYRKLKVTSKLELYARLHGDEASTNEQGDHAAIISELALSLEEAMSREKALGEVLRIIGGSGGNVVKVMPAILGYALELCDAEFGILFDYQQKSRFRASHVLGIPYAFRQWLDEQAEFEAGPQTGLGRLAIARKVINIADVRAEAAFRSGEPLRQATANLGGARSFVAIPMLAGEELVGAFTIYRQQVRPFNQEATSLAQIFAAQSVIALENARLFGALKLASNGQGSA